MRLFEYRDSKSNYFWSIELQGDRFTTVTGSGPESRISVKEYADEARAKKEYDRVVAERLNRGFVEVTTPQEAQSNPPPSLREVLEQAIFTSPDDLATHRAYADHLSELGDPRGELIAIQLALEDPANAGKREDFQQREKELLDANLIRWLGKFAIFYVGDDEELRKTGTIIESAGPDDFRFGWRRGWFDSLEICDLDSVVARELARCPLARVLRRLCIYRAQSRATGFEILARSSILDNVRHFQVGDEDRQCQLNGKDVVDMVACMPLIEELRIYAHHISGGALFRLPMPRLRMLVLHHSTDYPLEELAANPTIGQLEYLSCWPHAFERNEEGAHIQPESFAALVRSPHLSRLRHLRLHLSDIGDAGCEALVQSGILNRLEVLEICGGRITDAGARILAGCPDLPHLQRLQLSQNALTEEGIALLRATGVNLEAQEQFSPEALAEHLHLMDGDAE